MLLALLLAAGAPYSCPVECFQALVSERPLDCELVNADITLMLYAFDKHGPVGQFQLCDALSDVYVIVRAEASSWNEYADSVDCNGKQTRGFINVTGAFQPSTRQMQLGRSLIGLAHESLHAWEYGGAVQHPGELGWCGGRHVGEWSKNRTYMRMLHEYESQARGLQ